MSEETDQGNAADEEGKWLYRAPSPGTTVDVSIPENGDPGEWKLSTLFVGEETTISI
jgi:hypothetical protein